MSTPSLLNIPYLYKAGTLYSQIPESGAGDFTVTRTTTVANRSTRINKDGFIETVLDNVPRLDYPVGGAVNGCPALLVEPSATNLVPNGTAFNTSTDLSFTNSSDSPASSISGTLITKITGVTGGVFAQQTCLTSLPSGSTTYTISRFFKYNGTDLTTSLQSNVSTQWGGTNWIQQVVISAASGVTLGTSTNCTGSVENYGNGWYRVSARLTTGASPSGSTTVQYLMIVAGSVASGSSFLTALPQLETGSVATSYIPTTTAAVTRSAEVISRTSASALIGQTEGTFYLDLTVLSKGSSSTRWLQIFGASNNIGLAMNASNQFRSIVNAQSDILLTAPLISSGVKVAWAYDGTGTTCFINGTQYTLTNGGNQTMSSLTSLTISGSDNPQLANARIRAAALYPNRLTNAQLAALTAP